MLFRNDRPYNGNACLQFVSTGLYSRLNILITAVMYCWDKNFSLTVDPYESTYFPNRQWEDIFKPISDELPNKATEILKTNLPYQIVSYINKPLNENIFQSARNIALIMYQFQDNIQMAIENKIIKLKLPEKYNAIHIRRGDKLTEHYKIRSAYYNTNDYLSKIPEENTHIFITSDIWDPLDEIDQNQYTVYTLTGKGRSGHHQDTFNNDMNKKKSKEEQIQCTLDLLTEVEICRRSQYFVGTYSSNMSRFIHLVHNNPNHCIPIEEKGNWFLG